MYSRSSLMISIMVHCIEDAIPSFKLVSTLQDAITRMKEGINLITFGRAFSRGVWRRCDKCLCRDRARVNFFSPDALDTHKVGKIYKLYMSWLDALCYLRCRQLRTGLIGWMGS